MSHEPVVALLVANEAFLVSSTIARCAKTMTIRELMMDAIEAAAEAQRDKRIEISAVLIEGVPKPCTVRGMSASELSRICGLVSSPYKHYGHDEARTGARVLLRSAA